MYRAMQFILFSELKKSELQSVMCNKNLSSPLNLLSNLNLIIIQQDKIKAVIVFTKTCLDHQICFCKY